MMSSRFPRVPSAAPARARSLLPACLLAAAAAGTWGCAAPATGDESADLEGRTGTLAALQAMLLAEQGAAPVPGFAAESSASLPILIDRVQDDGPGEAAPAEPTGAAPAQDDPPDGAPDPAVEPPPNGDGVSSASDAGPVPLAADDPPQDVVVEGPSVAPPPPRPDEPAINPFLEFGERIIAHPDGRITKPYPVSVGKGQRLLQLLLLYFPFPIKYHEVAPGTLLKPEEMAEVGEGEVEVILLKEFDLELFEDLRKYPPAKATDVMVADWVMVTAKPQLLREVETFVNTFLAGLPQVEIEAKIVELTESDILDLGVRSPGGPTFDFPEGTFVDSFDFDFANTTGANEALLALGAVQDGTIVNMVLEAVETWENVQIVSQPKIVVREGTRADILNTQDIPFFAFSGINAGGNFNATLQFKQVGVQMYVVPRVLGTDTISLHIDIEASQQTGTLVSFKGEGDEELSTPVIAQRSARTVVHLKPGQAVILGGLTTERTQDREEKVPFLGDIPVLGYAFKNTLQVKERVHVLFFIRPRILQGAEFQGGAYYDDGW